VAVKKAKNLKKTQQTNANIARLITYFLVALIGAGLILNGYFFEQQSLTVNILTGGFFLLLLVMYYNKKMSIYYDKRVLILGLAFLVINIFGLFFASHVRDALQNVVIIANALLIFLLAIQAFQKEKNTVIFFKGLYWSIAIMAVISIFSFIIGKNILNFYPQGTRLFTSLGYPNTAALIFLIALFIGFFLHDETQNKGLHYLWMNSLLLISFMKTESRGVFLILPILIILYLVFLPKDKKITGLINTIIVFIPGIFVYFIAFNKYFASRNTKEIIIAIISLTILGGLYYLLEKVNLNNIKYKKGIAYTLIAVLLVGTFAVVIIEKDSLLNNHLVKRLETLGSLEKDRSIYSRVIFIKDALKIAKDHLLLGTGAGGWNAEYRKYRTFLYYTSQVHNHYVQVLVENGIIGFLLYLSLWVMLFYNLHKKYYKKEGNKYLTLLLLLISLALALHSFMDFDLTYPCIYFLWWIILALSIKKENITEFHFESKSVRNVIGITTILILFINSSLWLGNAYGKAGVEYMQKRNIDKAIDKLEASVIFDPFNPTYLVNLSQLYYVKGEKEKALNTLEKAVNKNPTNFEWYIVKTRFLVEMSKYNEAYESALKAIDRAPFEEVVYYDTVRFFVEKGDKDSLEYGKKILEIAQEEGEKIEKNEYKKWWRGTKISKSKRLIDLWEK